MPWKPSVVTPKPYQDPYPPVVLRLQEPEAVLPGGAAAPDGPLPVGLLPGLQHEDRGVLGGAGGQIIRLDADAGP